MTTAPTTCPCEWLQAIDPTPAVVELHDAFLSIEGPGGSKILAEVLRLAMGSIQPSDCGPLEDLAGRHNFTDPDGVFELAQTLDLLIKSWNDLSILEHFVRTGEAGGITSRPQLQQIVETIRVNYLGELSRPSTRRTR
jgi:hypothetical protein